eukprot:1779601-Karenia_brevis.AAC.1
MLDSGGAELLRPWVEEALQQFRRIHAVDAELQRLREALQSFSGSGDDVLQLRACVFQCAQVREVDLPIHEAKFSQRSIAPYFRSGRHYGIPLEQTIEELRGNPNMVWDCQNFQLDAAYCSGQLRVLNNR